MISTGLGGSRSTQAPAGRPMSSQGANAAAVSADTANGLALQHGHRQQRNRD